MYAKITYIYIYEARERQTDRDSEKETDRQTETQRDRLTDVYG